MSYYTWMTGNYDYYDACFNFHEAEDRVNWLEKIIKSKIGEAELYDEEGISKFKPLDNYENFERKFTTEGKQEENLTDEEPIQENNR